MAAHETLVIREVKMPSDKSFGFVAFAAFALISVLAFRKTGQLPAYSTAAASAFLIVTLFRSSALHPLNVLWMKFSAILARFTNPVIMGVLFYVAISPIALIMRLAGRDSLGLSLDRAAKSYWKERKGERLTFASLKNQF